MRISLRLFFCFFIGIILPIKSNLVNAMRSHIIQSQKNLEERRKFLSALTTVFADFYIQEQDIFDEEYRLKEYMRARDEEIDNEISDIMAAHVVCGGFPKSLFFRSQEPLILDSESAVKNGVDDQRLTELSLEKKQRRAHLERVLMAKLTSKQQAEVRDYVAKRELFESHKIQADLMGGIPFYELDRSVFIPFSQPRDRTDVCCYLMERKLSGIAESCKVIHAAALHCPEALALVGYEEAAARRGHKQLCLEQGNFWFGKLMNEFYKDEYSHKNYFTAFCWYQNILRQSMRYVNSDGDLKIPQNAGALLPVVKSELNYHAQAAFKVGVLCMLKVGVPRELANPFQAKRYLSWAASFDYVPAIWALITLELLQNNVSVCNIGRCKALFRKSITVLNHWLKDNSVENFLILKQACGFLSECVNRFGPLMPFATTYFDKLSKSILETELIFGFPDKGTVEKCSEIFNQLFEIHENVLSEDSPVPLAEDKDKVFTEEISDSVGSSTEELIPHDEEEFSSAYLINLIERREARITELRKYIEQLEDFARQGDVEAQKFLDKSNFKKLLPLYNFVGFHKKALDVIVSMHNKPLFDWYKLLCDLLDQECGGLERNLEKVLKLLEQQFSLIPEHTHLHADEMVGLDVFVRMLKDRFDNKLAQAALVRLGIALGFSKINFKKTRFIQNFIKKVSSSRNCSIQFLIGYLYYNGIGVNQDLTQAIAHFIKALENEALNPNIKNEVIYYLEQIGQHLFDVNFQATLHEINSYPQNDKYTWDAITACYVLVPELVSCDPLKAACMFAAAENTVAFLSRQHPGHEITYLPVGKIALNVLQEKILQRQDPDLLAALMFSTSCRYINEIVQDGSFVNLGEHSRLFLVLANEYFKEGEHSNYHRKLLMCLASNMYCIMGSKLNIQPRILIELMQGVVRECPEQYWFFRYNLESMVAGSQDQNIETLKPFRGRLASVQRDDLLKSMILSDYKRSSFLSWCSLL